MAKARGRTNDRYENHTFLKHITQDSQSMYNVTSRRVQLTTVAVEQ